METIDSAASGTALSDEAEARRKKTFERNKWFFSTSGIGRDMC